MPSRRPMGPIGSADPKDVPLEADVGSAPLTDSFAERSIPLLVEYTKKLRDIAESLKALRPDLAYPALGGSDVAQVEWHAISRLLQNIGPPSRQLSQQVSQVIEHGSLDPLVTIELRLRLAEFETALVACEQLRALPPPSSSSSPSSGSRR